jgi:hypothetical protein
MNAGKLDVDDVGGGRHWGRVYRVGRDHHEHDSVAGDALGCSAKALYTAVTPSNLCPLCHLGGTLVGRPARGGTLVVCDYAFAVCIDGRAGVNVALDVSGLAPAGGIPDDGAGEGGRPGTGRDPSRQAGHPIPRQAHSWRKVSIVPTDCRSVIPRCSDMSAPQISEYGKVIVAIVPPAASREQVSFV